MFLKLSKHMNGNNPITFPKLSKHMNGNTMI